MGVGGRGTYGGLAVGPTQNCYKTKRNTKFINTTMFYVIVLAETVLYTSLKFYL